MTDWRRIVELASADGVPRRSLWVAFIVGSLLNLINQGDALLGGGPVSWPKLGLTFLVPYLVSTYGAVAARLAAERRTRIKG